MGTGDENNGEVSVRIIRSETNVSPEAPSLPPKRTPILLVLISLLVSTSALAVSVMGFQTLKQDKVESAAKNDLYHQPSDLPYLVKKVREATLTIYCGDVSGSGWGIDLADDKNSTGDDNYPYEIVTNDHVIHDCASNKEVTFTIGDNPIRNKALVWKTNDNPYDIAVLITSKKVETLQPAGEAPAIGQWVMAVGSPGSWLTEKKLLVGNVTMGHVTNVYQTTVVTDAAVNYGNSGGPLVNARGEVVGTNSWIELKGEADNIAYAQGTPVLCDALLKCSSAMNWR